MDWEMVRTLVFFKLMWGDRNRDRKNIDFPGELQRKGSSLAPIKCCAMVVIEDPEAMVAWSAWARSEGRTIGFVPTMGALHRGHLDLVKRSKSEQWATVCSIFVNPLQFNDLNDLKAYPVRTSEDEDLLIGEGCDVLFRPTREALLAGFDPVAYDLFGLDRRWEGPLRPGHFQGVVNIVRRLFVHVRPDAAYFGQKDRQQLAIIARIAQEHRWPEKIVPCLTVREPDGLAMSSRNLRLSRSERQAAPVVFRALAAMARTAFRVPVEDCLRAGLAMLEAEPLVTTEYLGVAASGTLEPLEQWEGLQEAVALVAVKLGPVRLIDNLTLSPQGQAEYRG